MSPIPTPVQVSRFSEYVAFAKPQVPFQKFDIIIETEINLFSYCTALIHKIFELSTTQLVLFINYQINLMQEPLKWLSKFERLLEKNEVIFTSKAALCKFNKLFILIDKKRSLLKSTSLKEPVVKTPKRLINADSDDRYFSFYEVKRHIETLENYNDKIIYLTDEIFDYEEADIISINKNLVEFNLQCEKLKVRLQTKRKLLLDIENEKQEAILNINSEIKPIFKIRLNGPINILTDAYKQMMNTVKPNGKPYIEHKIKDIAQFICDSYVDDNGNELSMLTIQTYLSPTRTDKNPNNDWKIRL